MIKTKLIICMAAALIGMPSAYYAQGAYAQDTPKSSSSSSASLDQSHASDSEISPMERAWATKAGIFSVQTDNIGLSDTKRVADEYAIQSLVAAWGVAYDEGLEDVIASLFVEDVDFIAYDTGVEVLNITGRDKVLQAVTYAWKEQNDQRRHAMSNIVIDKWGQDTAEGVAYSIVVSAKQTFRVEATVVYSFKVAKSDNRWRFTRFLAAMDGYVGEVPVKN